MQRGLGAPHHSARAVRQQNRLLAALGLPGFAVVAIEIHLVMQWIKQDQVDAAKAHHGKRYTIQRPQQVGNGALLQQ